MTRSRATAKKAGASFERLIADHLKEALGDDRIDRQVRTGRLDVGDIAGVRAWGKPVVIEAKDYGGQILAAQWCAEAEIERGNRDALAGIVIAKRRGVTRPGSQWVVMTVDQLTSLLTGARPEGGD